MLLRKIFYFLLLLLYLNGCNRALLRDPGLSDKILYLKKGAFITLNLMDGSTVEGLFIKFDKYDVHIETVTDDSVI